LCLAGRCDCEPLRRSLQAEELRYVCDQLAEQRQQAPPQNSRTERCKGVSRADNERQTNQRIVENAVHSEFLRQLVCQLASAVATR
jgi:hypothetical protein